VIGEVARNVTKRSSNRKSVVAKVSEHVVETGLVAGREGAERKEPLSGACKGSVKERNEARTEQRPRVTTKRHRRETIESGVRKHVPVSDQKVTCGEGKRRVLREFFEETAFSGIGRGSVDVSDFYFPTMVAKSGSENAS
jgi:hypothetical protein